MQEQQGTQGFSYFTPHDLEIILYLNKVRSQTDNFNLSIYKARGWFKS